MKKINLLTCASFLVLVELAANADPVLFDNSAITNGYLFQVVDGQQVGNEITLGAGISLSSFEFEYISPSATLNSSLGVDVRFYLNGPGLAGGYPEPTNMIFDSGWFYNTLGGINPVGPPTGQGDLLYSSSDLYSGSLLNLPGGYILPNGGDFTYTITFTNVGSDVIYLPTAFDSAGTNYGTYWAQDNTGQWSLLTNSASAANFVVQFTGTVPEPSYLALGGLGSMILLGINRLRRKN
jgi:hypothetical protein